MATSVWILLAAGGGGGGGSTNNAGGGGGGAGGAYENTTESIANATYTITVGSGGSAGGGNSQGSNGGDSSISSIKTVHGGGGGGGINQGQSGGSGGGNGGGTSNTPASGTAGEGNSGGNKGSGSFAGGGGGGGYGGAGSSGSSSNGGAGGTGLTSSISGSSVVYSQGGDAGGPPNVGNTPAGAGGGGGGHASGSTSGGASGRAGVVIWRYPTANASFFTPSGTYSSTTSGSDTIITFTGSGSMVVNASVTYNQSLTGSLTLTPHLTPLRVVFKNLVGTLTLSGTLTKKMYVTMVGTMTLTGHLYRTFFKTLSASFSLFGFITPYHPVDVKINGVEVSGYIDWSTLRKTEVLTSQPDSAVFMIRNVAGKTYRPSLNDDVKFYRNGELFFGGVVISTREVIDGMVRYFEVTCKDYTEELDSVLVSKGYTSMTADDIIADLLATYAPDFTADNVSAPFSVDAVNFNYLSLSQCLQKLAEAIPGYDWYVDYNKDIHFFQASANPAPFSLDEVAGSFNWNSLEYDADLSQVRNSIVVRGGDVEAAAVDLQQVSDGVQLIYFVGYNLNGIQVYHAPVLTPAVFTELTVGVDGVDDPSTKDVLYNPYLGLLRFPSAYTLGDVIKTTGTPVYPLIAILQDSVSIGQYGTKEYLIVDKNITTKQQAIDRAHAELLRYAQPNYTGTFTTFTDGLVQGQNIVITLPTRGISGTFKIQKIVTTMRTPSGHTADLAYEVSFCSTLQIGMVDILNKLLVKDVSDQIDIDANAVPNRIYSALESITAVDVLVAAKGIALDEEVDAAEATNAAKDAGTIFVAGPYIPSSFADTKRQFNTDGSLLG